MPKEIKFSEIKEEIGKIVDESLKKNFDGKEEYVQEEAQTGINSVVEEVINNVHSNYKDFRFVVSGTIFSKEESSLNFSSTCLWNPNTDGSITQKYENDAVNGFVTVYGVAK